MRAAGADVWKGRWVVGRLDDLDFDQTVVAAEIANASATFGDYASIGVDMTSGLPPADKSHPTDVGARECVGSRRNSTVPIPPARMLERASAAAAHELAKARGWPRISAQPFARKRRTLGVRALAVGDKGIGEEHLEVSPADAKGPIPLEGSRTSRSGTLV